MSVTKSENNQKINEIIEKIGELNLGEVSDLVESLKKKFNIQEQVAVSSTATVSLTDEEPKKNERKVSVKLVEMGKQDKKIQVYKIVQTFFKKINDEEINLKKAMDITKKEDKIIFSDISQDLADELEKELKKEETGSKIEII